MNDDPFAPPEPSWGPPPYGLHPLARRGWPSWLIALVAILSGVALAGASGAGLAALRSASDGGSAAPAGAAASPGPAGPSQAGGTLQIDFPDGSTGTFTIPVGLHHNVEDDDTGHVALGSDLDGAAYLDLYTDETTASQARNLRLAASQDATDDRNHGDTTGAITLHRIGGRSAAQYRLSHHDDSGSFDALVTVVLVGHEEISLYWSDDAQDFDAGRGDEVSSALLGSLHVSGGAGDGSAV